MFLVRTTSVVGALEIVLDSPQADSAMAATARSANLLNVDLKFLTSQA
jgi:hypothetical protein